MLLTQAETKSADMFPAMEIFRFSILPLADIERREAFKEAVNNCPYCGTALDFQHEMDFLSNTLKEDCQCPACATQVRSEIFKVQ